MNRPWLKRLRKLEQRAALLPRTVDHAPVWAVAYAEKSCRASLEYWNLHVMPKLGGRRLSFCQEEADRYAMELACRYRTLAAAVAGEKKKSAMFRSHLAASLNTL